MSDVKHPLILNIVQKRAFRITNVSENHELSCAFGETKVLYIEFDRGEPRTEDYQIKDGSLHVYTDAAHTQRLATAQEALYKLWVELIPDTDTANLHIDLKDVPSSSVGTVYLDFVVRQGQD